MISTLDSFASVRALDQADSYADAMAAAQRSLFHDFLVAARTGDTTAPATFAGRYPDYSRPRRPDGERALVFRTVADVMEMSLGLGDGPTMAEMFGVLCKVATGDAHAADAQALLTRMATAWAAQNAEVTE